MMYGGFAEVEALGRFLTRDAHGWSFSNRMRETFNDLKLAESVSLRGMTSEGFTWRDAWGILRSFSGRNI